MLQMLSHKEHEAMIMFDRLLMMSNENETVADLLEQTLNVARMIDPSPDDKIMYGPLQRMHFEWQQMKYRMGELEKKMDNYINQQNRYNTYSGTVAYPLTATETTMWPSNPGWELNTKMDLTSLSTHQIEMLQNSISTAKSNK
jgi:hypothetical protein